ncbi:flagellar hook assembly protein FlgD [Litorimonas haliclonae]|uniref:flagellar hook assembly protein FlgD n=1 Tax=Litorimonas haliclonae TaxID=2081977 RepID=UPI0039EF8897
MNVPDLFALTTQTKPSSILRKGAPTLPQSDLTSKISGSPTTTIQQNGSEVTDPTATQTSNETDNSVTPQQSVGEEFDTFLTLLTAQIKNQDPLAPLDSTQFVEQLATFSNLELQAEGNKVLEDIAQMLAQNLYNQSQSEN